MPNWTWEVVIHEGDEGAEITSSTTFVDSYEAIDFFNTAVKSRNTMGALVIVHPSEGSCYHDSVMLAYDNDWNEFIDLPEWYEG